MTQAQEQRRERYVANAKLEVASAQMREQVAALHAELVRYTVAVGSAVLVKGSHPWISATCVDSVPGSDPLPSAELLDQWVGRVASTASRAGVTSVGAEVPIPGPLATLVP